MVQWRAVVAGFVTEFLLGVLGLLSVEVSFLHVGVGGGLVAGYLVGDVRDGGRHGLLVGAIGIVGGVLVGGVLFVGFLAVVLVLGAATGSDGISEIAVAGLQGVAIALGGLLPITGLATVLAVVVFTPVLAVLAALGGMAGGAAAGAFGDDA